MATILTPSIIAKEALMQLEANLVMSGLVHRDYSSEFVNVGDTITVRKPATFVAKNFLGTVEEQALTEGSVAVKMDRYRDITVPITSKEMTLDIKDFSEQVIKPAMSAIATAVDGDVLAVGIQKAGTAVSVSSTPVIGDIAGVGKALDKKKAPRDNMRNLVLGVDTLYKYNTLDNFAKVSYKGDSEALKNAEIGTVYTMNTFMSQNVPANTSATAGTVTAYKVVGTKGATEFTVSAGSAATGTIKVGDKLIVDGYVYTCKEDLTLVSGGGTLKVDEKIVATISTATSVTIINKEHSLGFHRNGLALVTRQLELPAGASQSAVASANGLAVRVVYGYDQSTKTDKISFDIIYGVKELNTDLLVDFA
jgi:hypothetical protein